MAEDGSREFYVRYYVGHKGKFGHEFLEFEFRPDGRLRYANNSNYKNASNNSNSMIRKEVTVSAAVLEELERIVADSEVTSEDDAQWPEPDRGRRRDIVCPFLRRQRFSDSRASTSVKGRPPHSGNVARDWF